MRVYGPMLALMAMIVGGVSAQAQQPRGDTYQTLIQDSSQHSDGDIVFHQQFNSMGQRLAAMEARLSSVETVNYAFDDAAPAASMSNGTDCYSPGCGDCCAGCNDCWCHPSSGVTFNSELLFLRAHDSEADDDGDDFATASRNTIGCMDACGREWRLTYFEYATELDESDYVQLEYIDATYAGRFTLGCNWRGELSGGLRWAQYDEEGDLAYSDTIGPVLGAMVVGPCIWGYETFASVRNSWQFGTPFQGDAGTFSVTEVQLGAQYDFCLCGGNGFLRGAFEVQKWDGVFESDTHDLGLIGVGFAVGMTR
jgi:hypothetical protein